MLLEGTSPEVWYLVLNDTGATVLAIGTHGQLGALFLQQLRFLPCPRLVNAPPGAHADVTPSIRAHLQQGAVLLYRNTASLAITLVTDDEQIDFPYDIAWLVAVCCFLEASHLVDGRAIADLHAVKNNLPHLRTFSAHCAR